MHTEAISKRILSPRDGLVPGGGVEPGDALNNVLSSELIDGALCMVRSVAALYEYRAADTTTESIPNVVAPADGHGRWWQIANLMSGLPTGTQVSQQLSWSSGSWEVSTPTFDVKDFGAVGNGVADDTTPVQAANTAAAAAGGAVLFSPGTYLVDDTTLGDVAFSGGVIKPLSGKTVELSGSLSAAANAQLFDISLGGVIDISNQTIVRVEWWGIQPSPSNSTQAFQQAINSVASGGSVRVPVGTWLVTNLTAPAPLSNFAIEGEAGWRHQSNATTIRFAGTGATSLFDLGGTAGSLSYGVRISNLILWGYQATATGALLDATYCEELVIENSTLYGSNSVTLLDARGAYGITCRRLHFRGGARCLYRRGGAILTGSSGTYLGCWFELCVNHAVLNPGTGDTFVGCVFAKGAADQPGAVECDADLEGAQTNATFVNCYMSDADADGTGFLLRGSGFVFLGGFLTATVDGNLWDVRIIQAAGDLSNVSISAVDWRTQGCLFDVNGKTVTNVSINATSETPTSGGGTFWEGGVEPADFGIMTRVGATAGRPSSPLTGQPFFDKTLSKIIVYNGAAWVNADGTAL